MIVVIADDLSGAAELAGAAANLGLTAEVHTVFEPDSDAEVVAVDTDTRERPPDEARNIVTEVARTIVASKPEWIFKKTDSVLRGNLREEIEAILAVTCQRRGILVPANPKRNRIIRDGIYYVDGLPLAETAFARDPSHPRRSSNVRDLLAPNRLDDRLLVPDVWDAAGLTTQAAEVDAATLPAGGVDFFEAVLASRTIRTADRTSDSAPIALLPALRTLFVCGSAAAWDHGRAIDCNAQNIPVLPMPHAVFSGRFDAEAMEQWRAGIASALQKHSRAMVAIGRHSIEASPLPPGELLAQLVEIAADVIESESVQQIFVEGGATAAALLRRFGWKRLKAIPTQQGSVAAFQAAGGPLLLIKPGSYPWPQSIYSP